MKIKVLCGIFSLSALTCAAQTATPGDSLRMDSIIHNLPEVMVSGERPMVKVKGSALVYDIKPNNRKEARRQRIRRAEGTAGRGGNERTADAWRTGRHGDIGRTGDKPYSGTAHAGAEERTQRQTRRCRDNV